MNEGAEDATALLLALTGYGHSEDIARAKEAGCGYRLTKPLDMKRLEVIPSGLGPSPLVAPPAVRRSVPKTGPSLALGAVGRLARTELAA